MIKTGFLVLMISVLGACNNDGKMKAKVDSLGKKFDSSAERWIDTAKKDLKSLEDKIKEKVSKDTFKK